jgi:CotH kinase protein
LGTSNRVYDLKTNELRDNHSDLARLISIINRTPDAQLECELSKILNIYQFLKALTVEVSAGHWDDYAYNKNNYFLYNNLLTERFEWLSYDTDNSFGVDFVNQNWTTRNVYTWHDTNNAPLVTKVLSITNFKNRYTYFSNQLSNTLMSSAVIVPRIDSLHTLIMDLYEVRGVFLKNICRKQLPIGKQLFEIETYDMIGGFYILKMQVGRNFFIKKIIKL